MNESVFFDPTQRRRRTSRTIALLLVTVAVAVLALFVMTLLIAPELPAAVGARLAHTPASVRAAFRPRHRTAALQDAQRKLLREIATEHVTRGASRQSIVAAFYAPWQESGLHSLDANADRITHLFPAWLRLSADGRSLDYTDWDPTFNYHNSDVINVARQHHIAMLPVLSNASRGQFDPVRAHAVLTDPAVRGRLIQELLDWNLRNRMNGANIDFENLPADDLAKLPGFLHELHAAFAPHHLALSADVESSTPASLWPAIAAECDYVVVMGYDEHSSVGAAGPIASIEWYRSLLQTAVASIPQQKLVIGIGNYAYDWVDGVDGAEPMSYEQALLHANDVFGSDAPRGIDFDPALLNPTYNYKDTDGTSHEVWMLDAATASNQWRLAWNGGVRSVAVWALGLEDPSMWQLFDRQRMTGPPAATSLSAIRFPYAVEFAGEGEILRVSALPGDGKRTLETDPATGMVIDESYLQFPSPYVIHRSGYIPKAVALTIDDGPAAGYTEQMLDILDRYGVKATFFVIGANVEKDPGVLERMWRDGHEIGNHSYTHSNMGQVSDVRAALELNATQRAIESATGRSTLLFRPPFNADAEPTTRDEVMPVIRAASLGYVTVGEFIDPQDWNLDVRTADGAHHRRTAQEIAAAIIQGVHSGHGNCVLLHDGGGDRTASVKALEIVIPRLKREGYRFVTASDLMASSRASIMPPVSETDRAFLRDDRFVFGATSRLDAFLAFGFVAAIILGISRILILGAIAGFSSRKKHSGTAPFTGPVSVVIAAFNEERVIAKTIESILRGTRQPDEIIVVDDGSTDLTASVVEQLSLSDPRVRLIRQSNQGKAAALNRAMQCAIGDVLVCVDADTMIHTSAVERLARHFNDPSIGAVAGNVKVGNRGTLVSRLQSVEYVTSQNIDRRAWALLDAITVVPGAIGAWRRSAVLEEHGYATDTVAEDMDLTWRLRRRGWTVTVENDAIAFTEAPETARALFKQRFRWAHGTLQCLWKHRDALGRYGWFGRAMLPSLWLFQIAFQLLSPIVDLQLLWTLLQFLLAIVEGRGLTPAMSDSLLLFGAMFVLFTLIDMLAAAVALHAEGESVWQVMNLPLQRFFYRQLMYAALVKSVATAVQGMRAGWGKLDRSATVVLPEPNVQTQEI